MRQVTVRAAGSIDFPLDARAFGDRLLLADQPDLDSLAVRLRPRAPEAA